MAKKSALGGALDSIFDDMDVFGGDYSANGGLQTLRIGEIEPNRDQPRKDFNQEKLDTLAESIRKHGLIQPITVRELTGDDGLVVYQIVAGERRWRAARMAELEEVPVRIMELTDAETMQIALIENLQREDLNPIEEAKGYQELIESYGMTQDELAGIIGKARSSVSNSIRLLTLPNEVLELVKQNLLSKGHCKAIMSAASTSAMIAIAKKAANGEISVREAEALAKETKNEDNEENKENEKKPSAKSKNQFFTETEIALGEVLNTKVKILDGKNKKTLCIEFNSDDELKSIVNRF